MKKTVKISLYQPPLPDEAISMEVEVEKPEETAKRKTAESSNSSPSASGLSQKKKMSKIEKVDPILFFKVAVTGDLNAAKKRVEEEIRSKCQGVNINFVKVTTNKNLLVYPQSLEDKRKILEDTGLFSDCERLN